MGLARDLSDLPHTEPEGEPEELAPDPIPRFVGVLAERWADEHDDNKPTAHDTRFRHSDAGKCARAISFTAGGFSTSDPMDLTGVWNVRLGQIIHDEWQEALQGVYPGAEIEVAVHAPGIDGSGHIDAVLAWEASEVPESRRGPGYDPEAAVYVVVVELKSIGGFGFKAAVGKMRRGTPAEGPKSEHLLQAALGGLAYDADEIVVAYLAKECISKRIPMPSDLDRFAAEWSVPRAGFEGIAQAELERVGGILALLDDGELAARKIPDLPPRAEIVDASTGRWEVREERDGDQVVLDTGTHWSCGYCPYQSLCTRVGPGRVEVEIARKEDA